MYIVHLYFVYRSQKTNKMQKDCGIQLVEHGCLLQGLSTGMYLGYTTTPRTVQTERVTQVSHLNAKTNECINSAIQVSIGGLTEMSQKVFTNVTKHSAN